MVDDLTPAQNLRAEADLVYLKFRKAFCSVPHRRKKHVLEQYVFAGRALECKRKIFRPIGEKELL